MGENEAVVHRLILLSQPLAIGCPCVTYSVPPGAGNDVADLMQTAVEKMICPRHNDRQIIRFRPSQYIGQLAVVSAEPWMTVMVSCGTDSVSY